MIQINSHEIVLDEQERLEPRVPYDRVITLAMDFIKNCPFDERNGLPWYLQYSCFWTDPLRPTDWPDNPAGKFAWAVTTLLRYYPYSGDERFIPIVRGMLERLWEQRTPADAAWAGVPYASAHPGTGIYFGARADGEYATEPDKVAQAGRAFVDFYEITLEEKFLDMGRTCADALLNHVRSADGEHSPWAFRVDVRDGRAIEEYTADMIPAVRLFDELILLGDVKYTSIRDEIWNWIAAFPLQNNKWKGYFEDIRLDPHNENRDQLSALETARYILENRERFPEWKTLVKGLIDWVRDTLGCHPFFTAVPIHEQKFCWHAMGSHTARFACLCAMYAELSGDSDYREQGIRAFNWATYMSSDDGTVTVGVDRPDYYNQCWFTDGYFDYVPHFIDGMAALPELAPADRDHLLRSSTPAQHIEYQPGRITYRVFNPTGQQKLRLTFRPAKVMAGSTELPLRASLESGAGWMLDDEEKNVVTIQPANREVVILG